LKGRGFSRAVKSKDFPALATEGSSRLESISSAAKADTLKAESGAAKAAPLQSSN